MTDHHLIVTALELDDRPWTPPDDGAVLEPGSRELGAFLAMQRDGLDVVSPDDELRICTGDRVRFDFDLLQTYDNEAGRHRLVFEEIRFYTDPDRTRPFTLRENCFHFARDATDERDFRLDDEQCGVRRGSETADLYGDLSLEFFCGDECNGENCPEFSYVLRFRIYRKRDKTQPGLHDYEEYRTFDIDPRINMKPGDG